MNRKLLKQLSLPFFLFLAIVVFFIITKGPAPKPAPPFPEKEYREFAQKLKSKKPGARVIYAARKGQRFYFTHGAPSL
ncbi:MAG: hypothetical protein KAW12_10705 [Candidatus Aminicenantes bacterium]|nr:hypothetical protein [Candidatus Aminicenantes bacterium]